MTAIKGESMLTGASIMAIVPTTDIARAREFYGETLGLELCSGDHPMLHTLMIPRCNMDI